MIYNVDINLVSTLTLASLSICLEPAVKQNKQKKATQKPELR